MSYKELGQDRSLTLNQLAHIQERFMKSPAWDASRDPDEQFRHLVLHIGKLMGKISDIAERREHNLSPDTKIVKAEVVPDLLFYAQQLAKLLDTDLQTAYLARLDSNAERVAVWAEERHKPIPQEI